MHYLSQSAHEVLSLYQHTCANTVHSLISYSISFAHDFMQQNLILFLLCHCYVNNIILLTVLRFCLLEIVAVKLMASLGKSKNSVNTPDCHGNGKGKQSALVISADEFLRIFK